MVRGKALGASVVPLPFVPHRYVRKGDSNQRGRPWRPASTRDHEWIRAEGGIGTVGITDYAQEQLGDIVYVEVPEVGRKAAKGEAVAVVESPRRPATTMPRSPARCRGQRRARGRPAPSTRMRKAGWFFKIRIADAADRCPDGPGRLRGVREASIVRRKENDHGTRIQGDGILEAGCDEASSTAGTAAPYEGSFDGGVTVPASLSPLSLPPAVLKPGDAVDPEEAPIAASP